MLTKRPERIKNCLPRDWGNGYPNVWLGVSTGCRQTLNKMDTLRRIPVAVRWISAEPLIEDISADINLDGFHWVVAGGESGSSEEYLWKPDADWKAERKNEDGRRTMKYRWAANLRDKVKAARLPFMFKQVTAPKSGFGYNALDDVDWHEFPPVPNGLQWAPRQAIPSEYKLKPEQIYCFKCGWTYPFKPHKLKIPKPMAIDEPKVFRQLRDAFTWGYPGAVADMRLFLSGRPGLRTAWMEELQELAVGKKVPAGYTMTYLTMRGLGNEQLTT